MIDKINRSIKLIKTSYYKISVRKSIKKYIQA